MTTRTASKATDKQIAYAVALLRRNGFRTDFMDRTFAGLGAGMRERSGRVDAWLANMDRTRISDLIAALQSGAVAR